MKALQSIVDSIVRERDDLLKEIESLEKREGYSRQSLDTLQDLNYAGYGLKELNQLKNTVFEIAVSNGMDPMMLEGNSLKTLKINTIINSDLKPK